MDWENIALIVVLVLLVLSGGYIKRLSSALKALIVCFDSAIQDGNISKAEWTDIMLEAKGVFAVVASIVKLVALKKKGNWFV